LRADADYCARVRMDHLIHGRLRDRRHHPVPLASEADRHTGLCPRVSQSGECDRRGPLSKHGPRYLRWGLMEAATVAPGHRPLAIASSVIASVSASPAARLTT